MIIVSDAAPLLNLAAIGQLNLLQLLYKEIIVPQAVYDELVVMGVGMPGAATIKATPWILVKQVKNQMLVASLRSQLDDGEAEALTLATELEADLLLLDERKARTVANQLGLRFTGLLGVLVEARHKEHIPSVKLLLDALIAEAGFWIAPTLYKHILEAVNEK